MSIYMGFAIKISQVIPILNSICGRRYKINRMCRVAFDTLSLSNYSAGGLDQDVSMFYSEPDSWGTTYFLRQTE